MNISYHYKKRSLVSLTPLIDVVFILLIFFMLVSSFTKWNIIELGTTQKDISQHMNFSETLITISLNHRYKLNQKSESLDQIIQHIATEMKKDINHSVFIQPENNLPLQQLITVIERVSRIQGTKISLIKTQD